MSALFPAIVAPLWSLAAGYGRYAFVRDADGVTWQANDAIPANTAFAEGFEGATWRRIADSGVAMAALYLKANVLPNVIGKGAAAEMAPAYIEDKLAAAEAQAARDLRTFFGPTTVFAGAPSAEEVAALNGAAYIVESAYDYNWEDWQSEAWGLLMLRAAPIISVQSMTLRYPYPGAADWPIPVEWVRVDGRSGQLRVVPTGVMPAFVPYFTSLTMSSGRRVMPEVLRLRYTAGLENVQRDFPDVLDLVRKLASLSIVDDRMTPGNVTTSVDGLSESRTVDYDKLREAIHEKQKNLFRAIHGLQLFVV